MLLVKTFTFNMFGVNTYLIINSDTWEAAIIDPGMCNASEREVIDDFIATNKLKLTHLINTHMHVDHIFGDKHIRSKYGLKIEAAATDRFLGEKAPMQCRMFGLPMEIDSVEIDVELTDGESITVCGEEAAILLVPGHSPGSIVLYFPKSAMAFTGDVIFQGSIGRTDLVAGNHLQLINGIRSKIMSLPDSTILYPGHGPSTTVGAERQNNPYI